MVSLNNNFVLKELSSATNDISMGEILQLDSFTKKIMPSQKSLLKIAYLKTGRLFEAASVTGGIIGGYSKKKVNTFASVFPTSDPKFVLAVMLDEPKANREFVYHYRDERYPYKGNWRNTAGWTTVWVTGQIIDKIGPILATKY